MKTLLCSFGSSGCLIVAAAVLLSCWAAAGAAGAADAALRESKTKDTVNGQSKDRQGLDHIKLS